MTGRNVSGIDISKNRLNLSLVFDPDMKAFFATISKAGTFQWERDVAANRAGTRWSPERPQQQDARVGFEDPFAFDQGVQVSRSSFNRFLELIVDDTGLPGSKRALKLFATRLIPASPTRILRYPYTIPVDAPVTK